MTTAHSPRQFWPIGAVAALLAASAGLVAALLARFPFNGLYGQDSYAYYGEALALWREITGRPAPPDALFSSAGLYHWPIGYHLHLMLGFLLAGPGAGGGRALTLLLTVLTPALVYALAGAIRPNAPPWARVVAGLLAGGTLLCAGVTTRLGLALMADVPALFWSVLGVYCALRAWPPEAVVSPPGPRAAAAWALAAGGALGLAILIRYGAALLLGPLALYIVMQRCAGPTDAPAGRMRPLAWAVLGLGLALLPQAAYLLTHAAGPGYAEWLAGWSPANLFRRTVTSGDGTSTFPQPMIVFYLWSPLVDAAAGFLSPLALPALALGLAPLVRGRRWPALTLLGSWWLGPALFFSATPYQAHRFVLAYLPALAVLIGLGGAAALEWALRAIGFAPHPSPARGAAPDLSSFQMWEGGMGELSNTVPIRRSQAPPGAGGRPPRSHAGVLAPPSVRRRALQAAGGWPRPAHVGVRTPPYWNRIGVLAVAAPLAAALVLGGIGAGGVQGLRAARTWAATQAAFQAQEQQVAALARQAAGPTPASLPPRAVAFGITAALNYYTGWPVLDFFNHDSADIARFLATPGPHLLVLPEASMSTQWAGTPVAARWAWMRAHYALAPHGQAGIYTVYALTEPHAP